MLKHVNSRFCEGPERAFAPAPFLPGQFDEAVIETEVVPNRILPTLSVMSVVGELVHDEAVDLAQCHLFILPKPGLFFQHVWGKHFKLSMANVQNGVYE